MACQMHATECSDDPVFQFVPPERHARLAYPDELMQLLVTGKLRNFQDLVNDDLKGVMEE